VSVCGSAAWSGSFPPQAASVAAMRHAVSNGSTRKGLTSMFSPRARMFSSLARLWERYRKAAKSCHCFSAGAGRPK
jgi:hypothetical protein